jgi:tetratricopeptide (TPR) repeat protein
MILQRSEEAVTQANLGVELDPKRLLVLGLAGMVMRNEGDYQSAILHLEKALSIDPNHRWAANVLSNVHLDIAFMNGDYEKWFEVWDKKVEGNWNDEGREAVLNAFHKKGHIAGIEEMFKMNEKYGDEGCLMTESLKAQRSIYLKNYDKAMEHLEKAFEMRTLSMTYMETNLWHYDQLKDNPRYIKLLKKMKLPLK